MHGARQRVGPVQMPRTLSMSTASRDSPAMISNEPAGAQRHNVLCVKGVGGQRERGVCESHGGQRAMGQARARHQHESGLCAHGTAAGWRIAAGAMRLSGGERTEDEEEGVDVGAVRLLWGAAAPELRRNALCRWC